MGIVSALRPLLRSPSRPPWSPLVRFLFPGALVLAACSGGTEPAGPEAVPRSLAEQLIIDELATSVGLGPLDPSCADPGVYTADSSFACTATTDGGTVVNVQATVNAQGRLSLATTNLITPAALPTFEREVAAVLNANTDANLTAGAVDCGPGPVVLPPTRTMLCALTMPASGEVFDVTLDITDLDRRRFGLKVADEPRSGGSGPVIDPEPAPEG